MSSLVPILPYIEIVLSILLIVAILIQKSEAGVGGSFGGSDNFAAGFFLNNFLIASNIIVSF